MSDIQVGSTVWIDGNPRKITGGTRLSWIAKVGEQAWAREVRFPKKPTDPKHITAFGKDRRFGGYRVFLTEKDCKDHYWANSNRHAIGQMVCGTDTATLRKIAALIGYSEDPRRG